MAHLTFKNRSFDQCLCGENIFTLARNGAFLKIEGQKMERPDNDFSQCLQDLKRVFENQKFWKKCDTVSTLANVYLENVQVRRCPISRQRPEEPSKSDGLPNDIRRYSRLPVCATANRRYIGGTRKRKNRTSKPGDGRKVRGNKK